MTDAKNSPQAMVSTPTDYSSLWVEFLAQSAVIDEGQKRLLEETLEIISIVKDGDDDLDLDRFKLLLDAIKTASNIYSASLKGSVSLQRLVMVKKDGLIPLSEVNSFVDGMFRLIVEFVAPDRISVLYSKLTVMLEDLKSDGARIS